MTQNRRTLRTYCRRACSALPGCWKEKKYFARHLRGSAEAFWAEHPDAGMGELEAALGEPEDLAAAFVESAGTAELLTLIARRRRSVRLVAAMCAVVLLGAVAFTWRSLRKVEIATQGTLTVEVSENGPSLPKPRIRP